MGRPNLHVDARMIGNSGIGVYIENVLERLTRDAGASFTIFGDEGRLRERPWSGRENVRIRPLNAPIYSVREQAELFLNAGGGCDLFWTPHFNAPLVRRSGKAVVTIHDTYHLTYNHLVKGMAGRACARLMYKRAARGSDIIMADSEFTMNEIMRHTGAGRPKIRVVPLGVPDGFRPASAEERAAMKGKYCGGRDYLLFVGNLKPNKNLLRLLDAFGAAARRGVEEDLLIVGRGEGFRTGEYGLVEKAEAAGVSGRVRFAGEAPQAELPAIYSAARALAFPSLYEGFGLPPLEAMACGTPALVSNAASIPEVCGDAALYCDPLDADDIAEKLVAIVSDAGLRGSLREKGYGRAAMFTFDRTARGVRDAFAEAMES